MDMEIRVEMWMPMIRVMRLRVMMVRVMSLPVPSDLR
jgi:hypothetical protein